MTASTRRAPISMIRAVRLGVGVLALLASAAAAYESLPALFLTLAAIMTLLALLALYQSARQAFGDGSATSGMRATLPERASLIDEKNALLRAIKDIAFEQEVDKLSAADYDRLDKAYRRRAKEVLRKLDEDLAPYLERARELVSEEAGRVEEDHADDARSSSGRKKKKGKAARRECAKCDTQNPLEAQWCKECGASMVPRACPSCAAENEHDAKFCIKCAVSMTPKAPAPPPVEERRSEPARAEGAEDPAAEDAEDPAAEDPAPSPGDELS